MRYVSIGAIHCRAGFLLCITVLFSLAILFINNSVAFASVNPQISAGWFHTFALKPDGSVSGWGYNDFGQLGDGTNTDKNIPVEMTGIEDVKAVACGWLHTVAVKLEGTVWAWGDNSFGQLGDKTYTSKNIPVQVEGLSDVVAIACGGFYTTALKADGTVWAWGDNVNGQLGDGTNKKSNIPVQVCCLKDVVAIASGHSHTVILKSDNTVWVWGLNSFGQLGDGTTVSKNTPVEINRLKDVIAITSGALHTTALKSDGTVWAWGINFDGELGDGTTTNSNSPVQVNGLRDIFSIAGGKYHTFAQETNGTPWAWGLNNYGQLGVGEEVQYKNNPAESSHVGELGGIVSIAGGSYHTTVLKPNGTMVAMGYNNFGQLGDGTTEDRNTFVEVKNLNLSNYVDAKKTILPLTVDGNLDELDWDIMNEVGKVVEGVTDNVVKFGALWDNSYLYVGVMVLDSDLYEDDGVEIYIDGNNEHETNYDSNDRQFITRWNDSTLFEKNDNTVDVLYGSASIPGGYSIELAIPWTTIGISPVVGMRVGFDIGNNDDDNGGGREGLVVWSGTTNNDTSTLYFGDVILEESLLPVLTPIPTSSFSPTPVFTPQMTPTPTPTPMSNGLAAYYAFDEGEVAIVADASNNGNYGTVNGAIWIAEGKKGGALYFDGIDDYIEIPGLLGQPSNITISAWANLYAKDISGAELISLGDYVGLRLDGDNGNSGFYYSGATWLPTHTDKYVEGTGWHHFAYVIDGTNNIQKVYIDGIVAGSTIHTPSISYAGRGMNTFIGRHGNNIGNYDFNGLIDEVQVYNRAMSDQEVQDLYRSVSIISDWKFDEGSGTAAKDSANNNDGVVNGAAWTTGMCEGSLSFDGVDDYIEIPGLLGQPENITISAWARLDAGDVDGAELISLGDYLGIRLDSSEKQGTMGFYYDNKTWHTTATGEWHAGKGWHHFAYVIDDTNNIQRVYIDGTIAGSTTYTPSISYAGRGANTFIGRHGNGIGNYDFNGLIDEVQVYNQSLSEQAVQDLYNNTCKENYSSLTQGNGTYAEKLTYETTQRGVLIASKHDDTTDSSEDAFVLYPYMNTDDVSFSARFYKTANDTAMGNIIFGGCRQNSHRLMCEGFDLRFSRNSPDRLVFKLVTQKANGNKTRRTATYRMSNSVGKWHYVVGTYKKTTGEQKLYVDGQLVDTKKHPVGSNLVPLVYYSDMRTGRSELNNGYFNGITVNDGRIYNRALNEQEVKDLINR